MGDVVVFLILVALVLGYISVLLNIRLGSLGVDRRRVIGIIVELWLTFVLIVIVFMISQQFVGPVGRTSLAQELTELYAHARQLPLWQRLVVYGGPVAAVLLFIHLLFSLRAVQQEASRTDHSSDGGPDDTIT